MDEFLKKLLEKARDSLRLDMTHIHTQAAQGKLPAASARDLASYIKLFSELEDMEKRGSRDLSPEQMKANIRKQFEQSDPATQRAVEALLEKF